MSCARHNSELFLPLQLGERFFGPHDHLMVVPSDDQKRSRQDPAALRAKRPRRREEGATRQLPLGYMTVAQIPGVLETSRGSTLQRY